MWSIEAADYGVFETLVYTFKGYAICIAEQDFEVIGIGKNEEGEIGMKLHLVNDDMERDADVEPIVMPFAHDIAFEVY